MTNSTLEADLNFSCKIKSFTLGPGQEHSKKDFYLKNDMIYKLIDNKYANFSTNLTKFSI